ILKVEGLSTGNGLMAMVTIVASAAGMVAGLKMYDGSYPGSAASLVVPTIVLVAVALAGWLASLGIPTVRAARGDFRFPLNPVGETWGQLRLLVSHKTLMRTALGIAFFFLLATLTQANVKLFGESVLHLSEQDTGLLMLALVVGVGAGSVLAGIWSGGRVEL